MDYKKFFADQVEWYQGEIAWATKATESENRRLEELRKDDKELVDSVWSRGVVTADEMRIFHKDFKGSKTKDALKWRDYLYRSRRRDRAMLKKYQALLAAER